ncbi:5-deoxy-glucuronate isomerase [Candidatus Poribacteria bacterium]|nr:5-deoxy-glucuronate isomerase [Candidatus Poribacteria bacterium]
MNLCHPYAPSAGYTQIVQRGDDDLRYLSFGVLSLRSGESIHHRTGDEEIGAILLGGKCRIDIAGKSEALGPRASVFDGYASAAYVPRRTDVSVTALSDTEIAVCSAPSDTDTEPAVVHPNDVGIRHVGVGNWTRTVTDIIADNVGAQRLIVGETYNPPGNWSSSPPHRHDNDNAPVESDMEEVYFFRMNPSQGFGVQRIYDAGRRLDVTYTVQQNDTVSIPYGYHPVAAAPGYELYYLWMLAGDRRKLIPYDDPQHAWVKK